MKNIRSFSLCLLFAAFVYSCGDPCDDVNCNNGTCLEGTCHCLEGWEGVNCNVKIDPCLGINCNNGTCNEAICNCDEGYEGEFCETEIREKYFGFYEGDLSICIPEAFAGTIDLSQFAILTMATLIVGPAAEPVMVNLSSSSAFLQFNQDVSILSPTFVVPVTVIELSDPNITPVPVTISANGLGHFDSQDTIRLDLAITFTLELLPFPIGQTCQAILTKI